MHIFVSLMRFLLAGDCMTSGKFAYISCNRILFSHAYTCIYMYIHYLQYYYVFICQVRNKHQVELRVWHIAYVVCGFLSPSEQVKSNIKDTGANSVVILRNSSRQCHVKLCPLAMACVPRNLVASYPGLPSQLFLQPWRFVFSTVVKKAARGGLGTRLRL